MEEKRKVEREESEKQQQEYRKKLDALEEDLKNVYLFIRIFFKKKQE
jgi:hypothetical protein